MHLKLEMGMPICSECDGGCYVLKKKETMEVGFMINTKGKSRYLVDVNTLVKDWNMIYLNVTATLKAGGKEWIMEQKVSNWAWCM